jgi:putative colanic acid biosynthesis acetyltransferase WcaF
MELSTFRNDGFDRGASRLKEAAWLIASELLVSGPLPGSSWRAWILRAFGSKIGVGVVMKPRVRVKFPWRLEIGAHSWIGERVWIDNLALVSIGNDVCVSQDAYLCTGNHNWAVSGFDLITGEIRIEAHCWVGARASVAPGTHMREGAILSLGSVGTGEMQSWTIYSAPRAEPVRARVRHRSHGSA